MKLNTQSIHKISSAIIILVSKKYNIILYCPNCKYVQPFSFVLKLTACQEISINK
jgi:hypothetical protein